MPGFFSKLFRRKNSASTSAVETQKVKSSASTTSKKSSQRNKGKPHDGAVANGTSSNTVKPHPLESTNDGGSIAASIDKPKTPTASAATPTSRARQEYALNHSNGQSAESRLSPRQVSPRVLSPRNKASEVNAKPLVSPKAEKERSVGPVDLDEESVGANDHDENRNRKQVAPEVTATKSPRLSFQHLEEFNLQQQQQPLRSPVKGGNKAHTLYHMQIEDVRRPASSSSHKDTLDDIANQSDASSSSFNLSTDAEDTEYENLKRGVMVPPLNASALDTSAVSGVSCPTNYTTDDDRALFPALLTDDEGTYTEKESLVGARVPMAGMEEDQERINIMPMAHETADDIRAWTISPSTQASFKENAGPGSPQFSFAGAHSTSSYPNAHSANTVSSFSTASPIHTTSSLTTPRKSFTTSLLNDDFADFADFSKVAFPASANNDAQAQGERAKRPDSQPSRARAPLLVEADFPLGDIGSSSKRRSAYSSASAAHPETSFSEFIAQSKAKRSSRSKTQKASSSSVNSAPTMTAQYLRQHHNLRPVYGDSKSTEKATSVSDVIQNLEASRAKASSSRKSSQRSTGDLAETQSNHSKDGTSESARSTTERLKERRRKDRELGSSSSRRHRSRSSELDSSDPSDNEASESWLFDEVTGALGPRGIAADLESLSGRSNRSKSSNGNKSHRSVKSHRSQRSSRRRQAQGQTTQGQAQGRSSSDSVDSRGSRTSRNSRNSRYSHRSSRSFMSQMSEQSRSVANDLLRLEMQLAMVGSQENREEGITTRGGGSVTSSVGGASRASRASRTSAATRRASALVRRSKVDVIAPPGKLGIILANKADSKGTVVSGVRTSSVLAEKISPGDRIVAIDGEDVSRMTVSEITTIMARKSDFERVLTVLTTPRHALVDSARSPTADFEGSASNSYTFRR